jgi:hypothetical protein
VGAAVGGCVTTGGTVGACVGRKDDVGVRRSGTAAVGAVVGSTGPGSGMTTEGSADPKTGDADAGCPPTASRVTLNPTSTTPMASAGPSSTYTVKEARPPWPGAWPATFPSQPTFW